MTLTATPAVIVAGGGERFTLNLSDRLSPHVYALSGLGSGWTVYNDGASLRPGSTDPVIYEVPGPAARRGLITIEPPAGYVGTLGDVTISRPSPENLIMDFDGGTFDFIGTAAPVLPTGSTPYAYHDPRTLKMCGGGYPQYSPCDGDYTIWPTANLHGPDRHNNNFWADIRSFENPMEAPTTDEVCEHWRNPWPFGDFSTRMISDDESSVSGKILVVNASTELPLPHDLVTTTVTGLEPDTLYRFGGQLANLSDDPRAPVLPVRAQLFANDTLIGTSEEIPGQEECISKGSANWVGAMGLVRATSSGTITLGVRNLVEGAFGNDLAIDQLTLFEMAEVATALEVVASTESGFSVVKSSSPESGSLVEPGQEIVYTVLATNTGTTTLDPVRVTDDLTDVLDNASFVAGSASASVGTAPVLVADTLVWEGSLPARGSVTLTYRVTVNSGLTEGDRLVNRVTGTSEDPEEPGVPVLPDCVEGTEPGCATEHTPAPPALEVAKDSDPESGSTVEAGQDVTYTLTFTNLRTDPDAADVPVDYTDHLADVLDDATLTDGPAASNDTLTATASGDTIRITGFVPTGAVYTVTYTVKVKSYDEQGDHHLRNVVALTGEEPVCVTDSPLCTEHDVPEPPPVGPEPPPGDLPDAGIAVSASVIGTAMLLIGIGGALAALAARRDRSAPADDEAEGWVGIDDLLL